MASSAVDTTSGCVLGHDLVRRAEAISATASSAVDAISATASSAVDASLATTSSAVDASRPASERRSRRPLVPRDGPAPAPTWACDCDVFRLGGGDAVRVRGDRVRFWIHADASPRSRGVAMPRG